MANHNKKHPNTLNPTLPTSKPVVLCILDGFGLSDSTFGNAIAAAKTPTFDRLFASYPHSRLKASGADVGVPDGQVGNSEVGHFTIGAGRPVEQGLARINRAISDGSFAKMPTLIKTLNQLKASGGTLHILGLASDGGVHAHIEHMLALIAVAQNHQVSYLLHLIADGRDAGIMSIGDYLKSLDPTKIATISGRYYAMDRDKKWERTALAFSAMLGHAPDFLDINSYIDQCYSKGITDEFIKPTKAKGYKGIKENDCVFFLNYRADRARQLSAMLSGLVDKNGQELSESEEEIRSTSKAKASQHLSPARFIIMMPYSDEIDIKSTVIFHKTLPQNTLGESLSVAKMQQLRLAETEKYAHVTFFFNGGREEPFWGEERVLIPSPKVATYDLQPQMSAPLITEQLIDAIKSGRYHFICVNYANADMVGHTGNYPATVAAIEALDSCLSQVIAVIEECGGEMLITADHGNAEAMYEGDWPQPEDQIDTMLDLEHPTNSQSHIPLTTHTTNEVPLIYIGPKHHNITLENGGLSDVAPTVLALLSLSKPKEMSGKSLIINTDKS